MLAPLCAQATDDGQAPIVVGERTPGRLSPRVGAQAEERAEEIVAELRGQREKVIDVHRHPRKVVLLRGARRVVVTWRRWRHGPSRCGRAPRSASPSGSCRPPSRPIADSSFRHSSSLMCVNTTGAPAGRPIAQAAHRTSWPGRIPMPRPKAPRASRTRRRRAWRASSVTARWCRPGTPARTPPRCRRRPARRAQNLEASGHVVKCATPAPSLNESGRWPPSTSQSTARRTVPGTAFPARMRPRSIQ